MQELNEDYWTQRYLEKDTGWDAGGITTPLKTYFDQLEDKSLKILIPGAGNAYEGAYLFEQQFLNTYILDISTFPLEKFQEANSHFPADHLLHKDFFDLEERFDLIVEQTFFCALVPSRREAYVQKMLELLKPQGKLVGLLFTNVLLDREDPPYGERAEKLRAYFEPYFQIRYFEPAYNSIKPRQGSEYFIHLTKPSS